MLDLAARSREEARSSRAEALAWLFRCWLALFLSVFALAEAAPAAGLSSSSVSPAREPGAESALTVPRGEDRGDAESEPGSGAASLEASEEQESEGQEPQEPQEVGFVHGVPWAGPAGARLLPFSAERAPRSFVRGPRPRPAERS